MREVTMFSVFDFRSLEELCTFTIQCYHGGNDSVYFENEDLRLFKNDGNPASSVALAAYSLLMGNNPKILEDYNRWKAAR